MIQVVERGAWVERPAFNECRTHGVERAEVFIAAILMDEIDDAAIQIPQDGIRTLAEGSVYGHGASGTRGSFFQQPMGLSDDVEILRIQQIEAMSQIKDRAKDRRLADSSLFGRGPDYAGFGIFQSSGGAGLPEIDAGAEPVKGVFAETQMLGTAGEDGTGGGRIAPVEPKHKGRAKGIAFFYFGHFLADFFGSLFQTPARIRNRREASGEARTRFSTRLAAFRCSSTISLTVTGTPRIHQNPEYHILKGRAKREVEWPGAEN